MSHRELYMKYFVIKMKQKFYIDKIIFELSKYQNIGTKRIMCFDEIVQIFLDSMIDEKNSNEV